MMSNTAASAGVGRSKFPFTATQWQELEHQALGYKYIAAGIPIPPDLFFSIKRSLDSSLSSKLFPYQSSPLGWNSYQMGYGKKIDTEPGRCRRTDGKKWRCSKEAYPDSKYCERHMHRGKNRSRKPVENNSSFNSTLNNNSSPNSATFSNPKNHPYFLHSLDPSPYSLSSSYNHKDYIRDRYINGIKEEVGEHAFFGLNSGPNMRGYSTSSIDESWPLGGSLGTNLEHSKQSGGFPNDLQQFQSNNNNNIHHLKQQDKQCFIWGRDFNSDLSMKVEEDRASSDKTIHHFFDEWPLKDDGGDDGGRDSSWHDSSSTTRLSISIPNSTSHHDFFLSNSRTHHDG